MQQGAVERRCEHAAVAVAVQGRGKLQKPAFEQVLGKFLVAIGVRRFFMPDRAHDARHESGHFLLIELRDVERQPVRSRLGRKAFMDCAQALRQPGIGADLRAQGAEKRYFIESDPFDAVDPIG